MDLTTVLGDVDLANQWPLVLIGLVVLLLAIILMTTLLQARHPRGPMAAVVGATAGLQTAQVGGLHVFCVAVAAWLLFGVLREPAGRPRVGRALAVVGCAAPLASTALTGEMVNSGRVAVQLMVLAATAACLAAFGTRADVRPALLGLLAVISVGCLVGLMQYVGVVPYAGFDGTRRPIGIYLEPDWLGMYSAVGLIIAFRIRTGRWRAPLVCLTSMALLLAAARAAWLAVVVVTVLGLVVSRFAGPASAEEPRPRIGDRRMIAGALVVVAVALVVSPKLQDSLLNRVVGTSTTQPDVSALARQQQNSSMLTLDARAPWNGLGLSASGRVGVSGRIAYLGTSDNNVASNWILGWWVDGGWLSLPLILMFVGATARRINVTSGLALAAVLVSSLFSNALMYPIAWFCVALCLMNTERRPSAQVTRQNDDDDEAAEVRANQPTGA